MENSLSLYPDQCSQVYYDLPISLVSYHIFQMNSLSPSILKNITKVNIREENNFKECSMTENNNQITIKELQESLSGKNLMASLDIFTNTSDPPPPAKYRSITT